jgi:chromosome segregation ATPase
MESRMEESILNHSVAISRIEDCEDDMQVCKGDIDAVKIEQASMARDVRMLEASMGSIHEQLEDLADRVDGQHAVNRRTASLLEDHTRFITLEVLRVRQEGRSQYEGCLGKVERIGDLIDKKIVHMDEELDKVVGLIRQKIDAKFGEFSSDFMEAMEIEENQRKALEEKVAFLEEKLTDSFLRMSDLTNLVLSLQSRVSEVEDAVMEKSEDDGGEVASSSSSDLDPVENLVAIPVPAPSIIHMLVEIPEEFVPPILWPSSAVLSTPSPEYVEAVEDDPVHDGTPEYWADPEAGVRG